MGLETDLFVDCPMEGSERMKRIVTARHRHGRVAGVLAIVCASLASTRTSSAIGVVVERLPPGAAVRADASAVGDLLLRWERPSFPGSTAAPVSGSLGSPFEWLWVDKEQAPRGSLRLFARRAGKPIVLALTPEQSHALEVGPLLHGRLLAAYLRGKAATARGDTAGGLAAWQALLHPAADAYLRSWLLMRAAASFIQARNWPGADDLLRRALAGAPDPQARVAVLDAIAGSYEARGDCDQAIAGYATLAKAYEESWGIELGVAHARDRTSVCFLKKKDYEAAEESWARALEIRQRLAPGSSDLAATYNNLGNIDAFHGNAGSAEVMYLKASEIWFLTSPGTLDFAALLHNLGKLALERQDSSAAECYLRDALEITSRQAAESEDSASNVDLLGEVYFARDKLELAVSYYTQARDMRARLDPQGLPLASSLNNLGRLAQRQDDLPRARSYFQQAFDIVAKQAPGSAYYAEMLTNLAGVARAQGDYDGASRLYTEGLELMEIKQPGTPTHARMLANAGGLSFERGDYTDAQRLFQKAFPMTPSDSYAMLELLSNLAAVSVSWGDSDTTRAYCQRALVLELQHAEETGRELANTRNLLGVAAALDGDLETALSEFEQSAETLRHLEGTDLPKLVTALLNLGNAALEKGDLAKAEESFGAARDIAERTAPKSLPAAGALAKLGKLASKQRRFDAAETYFRAALAIHSHLAPASLEEAEDLEGLATVAAAKGAADTADAYFKRSLAALERELDRLAGSHEM
jgi:tetratricopeptide (TPR) repeat protein